MSTLVDYGIEDGVARLTLDDGKANALSPAMVEALDAALDRAEKDPQAKSVILHGRPQRFCAGFDLRVLMSGREPAEALVRAGFGLFMRVYGFPKPVVIACTGHALAGGAVLLLGADVRIGTEGSFKIGLNEVAIGIEPPRLIQRMAADRLDRRFLTRAVLTAEVFDPAGAQEAGYLDQVVDEAALAEATQTRARELARLPAPVFARGKAAMRGDIIDELYRSLDADLDRILAAAHPADKGA